MDVLGTNWKLRSQDKPPLWNLEREVNPECCSPDQLTWSRNHWTITDRNGEILILAKAKCEMITEPQSHSFQSGPTFLQTLLLQTPTKFSQQETGKNFWWLAGEEKELLSWDKPRVFSVAKACSPRGNNLPESSLRWEMSFLWLHCPLAFLSHVRVKKI